MARSATSAHMHVLVAVLLVVGAHSVRPMDRSAIEKDAILQRQPAKNTGDLPVVLWHGMGDSCCASFSIGAVKAAIEKHLGVYVHSVATGSSTMMDIFSGYFGNVNDQVAAVCNELRSIPQLQGGFNAVGFSQGGQFLRAVVERCQHTLGPVRVLVTMGGQHQGVMNVPGCIEPPTTSLAGRLCHVMQHVLSQGAYLPMVRSHVVQAQYFKDPERLEEYKALNPFLPDINNEHGTKNGQYAANLASLQSLVLMRFLNDETVVPRDSAWFSVVNGSEVVPLRQQALYTEDWLGLRQLDERGALLMEEAPGQHMQFTLDWFLENVVDRHLRAPKS